MRTPWVAAGAFCLGVAAGYGLFHADGAGTDDATVTVRRPAAASSRTVDTIRIKLPPDGAVNGVGRGNISSNVQGAKLKTATSVDIRATSPPPDIGGIVASWLDDTLVVDLPRRQLVYEDESYTAWVSGVVPALDSIAVRIPKLSQPRRWSVAVQAGVGITPAGPQPYIGLGLSFSLTRR